VLLSLTNSHASEALIGFALIFVTALVQLLVARADWRLVEESIAPVAAVLIIGLGHEQVTASSLLWLAAVASGVLARGGRIHWIGRAVLLSALGPADRAPAGADACLCGAVRRSDRAAAHLREGHAGAALAARVGPL
jgi:hypothetical protein